MDAFVKALLFVVIGEMGDKTQLLAMAMAGRYRVKQVMLGVFIATILNHGLAVLVGSYMSAVLPLDAISMIAGASFVLFALWTIRGDDDGGKGKQNSKFGPVVTVAIAFFLAEMGDKTQLMTITIAAEFRQPLAVLIGTTTGMLIADAIGVLFGVWICQHIREEYIKWGAGIIFMFFGVITLYNSVPEWILSLQYILPFFLVLGGLIYFIGFRLARRNEPCADIPEKTKEPESQPVVH